MEFLHSQTPIGEVVMRLAIAVAAGLVLGIDREARSKPAGLRTHMLISLASALLMLLTFELTKVAAVMEGAIRADPVRVTEAVVTGVAFLGAGTIIRSRGEVRGITTGVSLWLAGAVGAACGGGFYALAALGVTFAMVVLTLIGYVEHRLT